MKRRRRRNPLIGWLLMWSILVCIFLAVISNVRIESGETELIEVGSTESYTIPVITLFDQKVNWPVSVEGEVDINTLGEYEIYYRPILTFDKIKQIVQVVDTTAPQIILIGETEVVVDNYEDYKELGAMAIDNYDGDLSQALKTQVIKKSESYYEIEYSVQDSSHNLAVATRILRIVKGTVCLTFDDGPSLDITPEILDLLKEKNVKATFFLVRFGEDKAEIVRRAYEEGHTIALHGYSHDYAEIYTSLDSLVENFKKIEELVEETIPGYDAKYIRFPGGSSNTISKRFCLGIMSEAVKVLPEYGYVYFDWNVDSQDAGGANTSDQIYENVISGILPGRTNIVLMHDSSGHQATLDALERVIDYCLENCYEIMAITESTYPVHHKLSN